MSLMVAFESCYSFLLYLHFQQFPKPNLLYQFVFILARLNQLILRVNGHLMRTYSLHFRNG